MNKKKEDTRHMKVLVTGGAGFIGSHLVDALVDRGDEVVVVDDMSTGNHNNLNPAARLYDLSITDATALKDVFERERPDIVDHHAAQTSVRRSMTDPSYDATVNIVGSINVLQNCVDYETKRLLFASSCAVYAPPIQVPMKEDHPVQPESAYGLAKHTVENYIRYYSEVYGLRYKIFRYGNVFGARQNPAGEAGVVAIFAGQLLNGDQTRIFGDGKKTRDYVYVADIVEANLIAMEPAGDNDVYNLARTTEVSDFEIYDAVRRATQVEAEPEFTEKRPGEALRVCLDCENAKQVLGWSPRVQLDSGVRAVVSHFADSRPELANT